MNIFSYKLLNKALFSFLLFASFTVNASMTQITAFVAGENDCSGYFGKGAGCKITAPDDPETPAQILAVIMAKFDYDENKTNSYNSASASDFTKSGTKTGNWSYGGSDFSGIKFWAAKAGNGFNLFWMVNNSALSGSTPACDINTVDNTNFNLACMSLAQSVTQGNWSTPQNKGLSHLTFYGDNCADPSGCYQPSVPVSEPSTLIILLSGFILLFVRKQNLLGQS